MPPSTRTVRWPAVPSSSIPHDPPLLATLAAGGPGAHRPDNLPCARPAAGLVPDGAAGSVPRHALDRQEREGLGVRGEDAGGRRDLDPPLGLSVRRPDLADLPGDPAGDPVHIVDEREILPAFHGARGDACG